MPTAAGRNRCVRCGKEKATLRCGGCLQEFCYNHLADHRQELGKKLYEIEVSRDFLRQTLNQQTSRHRNPFIQQINDWERDSIKKIQRTAEEARQTLFKYTITYSTPIEVDLNTLNDNIRQSRKENDFYETDLHHWNEELKRLSNEINKPWNINLREHATPFINQISVDIKSTLLRIPNISASAKWIQNGVTVVGGNGQGNGINQLNVPYSLYIDDDQDFYIAEHGNHRVVKWKNGGTSGRVVAGGNGEGNRNDQLNSPTDVILDKDSDSLIISDYGNKRVVRWPRQNGTTGETIISNVGCWGLSMDSNGYLYVSDVDKHEVRRWHIGDTTGAVIAGGHGIGNRFNQLNYPTYIFIDQDHSVYVSDYGNNRVMKWKEGAKEGIVVAGGQRAENGSTQLHYPYGIVVDHLSTVYMADCSNGRVIRWPKGATQGNVVAGGNGPGEQANQLSNPMGLSFDRQGNLYVVDYSNHRVQKFNIYSTFNT